MNVLQKAVFGAGMACAMQASAAGMVQWQDNSLTYLWGQHFEVNPEIQQTITFEHVSGWSVGDLFVFVDYTNYNGEKDFFNGDSGLYGEFSPRFSFSKILDKQVGAGFVKDVLVATTYEFGEGDVETLLLGLGADLEIPGMDFFSLNVYRRFPDKGDGETIQITPTWSMTFPVGNSQVIFDGFMDWNVNDDDSYESNLHFNPQLKYDLGQNLGLEAKKLLVGIEYDYWSNKYGLKDSKNFDTDQSVTSLLVKGHF